MKGSQPIGEIEDKLRAIVFALDHTSLSSIAKETYIIKAVEALTGFSIEYRPQHTYLRSLDEGT